MEPKLLGNMSTYLCKSGDNIPLLIASMKTYILHELVPVSYSEVKSKGLVGGGCLF